MNRKVFICTGCKSFLDYNQDVLLCPSCRREWKVKENIPVFLESDIGYWGELSYEDMQKINENALRAGWQKALAELNNKEFYHVIQDEYRADFKYFLEIDKESTVLDIGSGLGNLSFSLVQSGATVYGLEPVWERVRFSNIRARQEEKHNFIPVCSTALTLPFPDNSFDIVILNGVLEWVGYFVKEQAPHHTQLQVMREAARVLRRNGTVYIGIENRFAAINFLGVKDAHSGLPFITLLPRFLANIYSLLAKKTRYTTYLYSYAGYKRLLKKSGLRYTAFYAPLPSYRNFNYIFPLSTMRPLRYWMRQIVYPRFLTVAGQIPFLLRALHCIFRLPIAYAVRWFTLDYSIIARSQKVIANKYKEIIRTICKDTQDFCCMYAKGTKKKVLFCFLKKNEAPSYIVKATNDHSTQNALSNEALVLDTLHRNHSALAQACPTVLFKGMVNNELVQVQTAADGEPLTTYVWQNRKSFKTIDALFTRLREWLILLHKTSFSEGKNQHVLINNIFLGSLQHYASDLVLSEDKKKSIEDSFRDDLSGIKSIALSLQHRDFGPHNIAYKIREQTFSVYDWEYATFEGFGLVDLLQITVSSCLLILRKPLRRTVRLGRLKGAKPLLHSIDIRTFTYLFYEENELSHLVKKHVTAYCTALGVDVECIVIAMYLFILELLSHDEALIDFFLDNKKTILQGT